MVRKTALRLVLLATVGLGLASCQDEVMQASLGIKHLRPLSPEIVKLMNEKGMRKDDPILIRIFKEESTLEVWKRDKTGRYAFLKDYRICAWGGTVGPKIKQGDKQSPEGFYMVTPGRMNPNSAYYLSFDIGFPNAFDRVYGRTGTDIMVHGACSSAGCFAMTDAQVAEIYALARDALAGGQKAFQVQSFPFRMTAQNMAKHRNNPNMAFWRNIKKGYDHFEVSRLEPKVDVCDRRYVFDAQPKDPVASTFNPAAACPAYDVPQQIASLVAEKEKKDDEQYKIVVAELDEKDRASATAELERKLEKSKPPQPSMIASIFGNDAKTAAEPAMTPIPINAPVPRPAPGRVSAPQSVAVAMVQPVEAAPAPTRGGMMDRLFSFGSSSEPSPSASAAAAALAETPAPTGAVPVAAPVPAAKPIQAAAVARPAAEPITVTPVSAQAPAPAAAPASPSFWQKINPFGG
ncbi:L,D-transpeptidase family protein [Methyloraptor flagellatus]|uniref:Murein L,D-transpeptidase family protein n=1 Tax=Methyloraptor flagellatus TaxID=3162530 RepID=A0AAU7XAM6_9HYPH